LRTLEPTTTYPELVAHINREITQRYLNITDVGVVRPMPELWGRRRAAKDAQT
jgi:hypothetical protein